MKVIFLHDQAEKYNVKNVTKSVFKTLKTNAQDYSMENFLFFFNFVKRLFK